MFRYEHVSQPLLPRRMFIRRLLRHGGASILLLLVSLAVGVLGYALLDQLSLVDAFVNASMILGGMGPVDPLKNDAAKIFAGLYALYSGLVVLVAAGVIFAPIFHRIAHGLHLGSFGAPKSGPK